MTRPAAIELAVVTATDGATFAHRCVRSTQIGDAPASFFSRPQQEAIEQAVLNGSALFMIGGTSTLGPGDYQGTAMEKALPVLVGPRETPQEMTQFNPRLTAEGARSC